MYLNILMTLVAVYVMLLPFLMFYFMTLIKADGVHIETPKQKKANKKKDEEVAKSERKQKTLERNIDVFDGTPIGQIPIEE